MGKKKKGNGWLVLLIVVLFFAYRNHTTQERAAGKNNDSPAVTQQPKIIAVVPTPSPQLTAPPEDEDPNGYPAFVAKDALVIDGTEESREYDYLVQKAFEDRVPDFWLKNHRFYGSMDFKELDCGCFWVKSMAHSDQTYTNEDGSVDTYQHLFFTYYDYSSTEIAAMKAELASAANAILSRIPAGADTWVKVKTIHDQLCATVTYDHSFSKPHIYDAYGALVRHEAVCAGYASAFSYLLRLANIGSESSYSDNHAWTHVWLWSPESYVDATWDDPDMTDRYGRPYIKYDYFLITFDELRRVDSHSIISEERTYYDKNYGNTPLVNNYYGHEGCLLYSCDEWTVINTFMRQLEQPGTNLLTVRFYDEKDYLTAKYWDSDTLGRILRSAGYVGTYIIWKNDTLRTVSIGLYY